MKRDTLKNFMDEFISLSRYHYHNYKLDKEVCLNYSANELDMAYNCGYFSFLNEYFDEFEKRKAHGEFKDITIIKTISDFLIVFNESILGEEK
ncbi:MAG: hypothetical protein IJA65_05495 [Acholeplasmatales bacterium]|nr:hypothetical protein [Acholeplasmatales bacterium]